MTVSDAVPWPLVMAITSLLVSASCAVACWIAVSRSSQLAKSLSDALTTPPSDAKLAQVLADQAELSSTLERLTTTIKRLSSRAGMEDLRSRRASEVDGPPPIGADKATLRRYYGLQQSGPEFARAQLRRSS